MFNAIQSAGTRNIIKFHLSRQKMRKMRYAARIMRS